MMLRIICRDSAENMDLFKTKEKKMKIYLVCILDSDNYREPTFLFFKKASEAHEYIKNLILSELKSSNLWSPKTEINYVNNSDGSDDQILRIDYSFGDGVFYVHTVHEIEVEDQDYICVYHHAYNGVGFYIEKTGSLEECQQQMKTSAINSATDFGIDMKNDGFFEVNSKDSCVDVGEEYHMCDIIQFNVSEILKENTSEADTSTNTIETEEKSKSHCHKYRDDVYQTMKCLYEPIHQPVNPKDYDREHISMEEVIKAVDDMDETEFFEHLCELHGIPCSTVEYLYETAYGSSERKKNSHYVLQRRK